MITIIRNDPQMKFCHDVVGVKIKPEKPYYQIIAILHNEGLPVFKSVDYEEVERTFDKIVQAIISGASYIVLDPPQNRRRKSKEECMCDGVLDFDSCNRDDLKIISPDDFRDPEFGKKPCRPPILPDHPHHHPPHCPPPPPGPVYNDDDNVRMSFPHPPTLGTQEIRRPKHFQEKFDDNWSYSCNDEKFDDTFNFDK